MLLGVVLPRRGADPRIALEAARAAEEAGLASVWVSDHLWGPAEDPAALEGWTLLAAVAASTRRVTVGTLVARVTLRPPALTAAAAANLARIAPGRLVVGLGIGDPGNRLEEQAYGYSRLPGARRLALLEETIHRIREAVPGVPVWVGGRSERLLAAAQAAEGWNLWGSVGDFGPLRERLAGLAGDRMPATSWGGSYPGPEGLASLEAAGADHALVAVGAGNFRERLARLSEQRDRRRPRAGAPPSG